MNPTKIELVMNQINKHKLSNVPDSSYCMTGMELHKPHTDSIESNAQSLFHISTTDTTRSYSIRLVSAGKTTDYLAVAAYNTTAAVGHQRVKKQLVMSRP